MTTLEQALLQEALAIQKGTKQRMNSWSLCFTMGDSNIYMPCGIYIYRERVKYVCVCVCVCVCVYIWHQIHM